MDAQGIGVVVGLIVGIIIVICIFKFANKDHKRKTEYDERQEIVRGRAYKYAFATMLFYMVAIATSSFSGHVIPVDPGIICFAGVLLGICVLAGYSIMKDAYWGLNNNRSRYLIVFALATVINAACAIAAIVHGEMIVEGQIQAPFINLMCAVMFLVIAVFLLIKKVMDNKMVEEDD